MENYVYALREDNVLMQHQYNAGYDLEQIESTAKALGMIPVSEAQTISIHVELPPVQEEPGIFDNVVWFLSGLFA
jgi:hypothetical protein